MIHTILGAGGIAGNALAHELINQTPYKPCSKKGEIRANVAKMLDNEMRQGTLQAIIARSADVYGPYA
jgi:hypothetical protein